MIKKVYLTDLYCVALRVHFNTIIFVNIYILLQSISLVIFQTKEFNFNLCHEHNGELKDVFYHRVMVVSLLLFREGKRQRILLQHFQVKMQFERNGSH